MSALAPPKAPVIDQVDSVRVATVSVVLPLRRKYPDLLISRSNDAERGAGPKTADIQNRTSGVAQSREDPATNVRIQVRIGCNALAVED